MQKIEPNIENLENDSIIGESLLNDFPIVNIFILSCLYVLNVLLSLLAFTLPMAFLMTFFMEIYLIVFMLHRYGFEEFRKKKLNKSFIFQLFGNFIPIINFFPWTIWYIWKSYQTDLSLNQNLDANVNSDLSFSKVKKLEEILLEDSQFIPSKPEHVLQQKINLEKDLQNKICQEKLLAENILDNIFTQKHVPEYNDKPVEIQHEIQHEIQNQIIETQITHTHKITKAPGMKIAKKIKVKTIDANDLHNKLFHELGMGNRKFNMTY